MLVTCELGLACQPEYLPASSTSIMGTTPAGSCSCRPPTTPTCVLSVHAYHTGCRALWPGVSNVLYAVGFSIPNYWKQHTPSDMDLSGLFVTPADLHPLAAQCCLCCGPTRP
jgi:hypothetical protein